MGVSYRLQQFGRGLAATVRDQSPSSEERALLATLLSPSERRLFDSMPVDGQRHSLNVLNTLRSAANDPSCEPPRELLAAALLHDVGKVAAAQAGAPITLWLRGPLVILEHVAPHKLQNWASSDAAHGWRYALHVHLHHAAIGARWAAEAGAAALTCWLIAQHQSTPPIDAPVDWRSWLTALQSADGQN